MPQTCFGVRGPEKPDAVKPDGPANVQKKICSSSQLERGKPSSQEFRRGNPQRRRRSPQGRQGRAAASENFEVRKAANLSYGLLFFFTTQR
jgi:hypothetical protein